MLQLKDEIILTDAIHAVNTNILQVTLTRSELVICDFQVGWHVVFASDEIVCVLTIVGTCEVVIVLSQIFTQYWPLPTNLRITSCLTKE